MIVVTGGCGFIGSNLVHGLNRRDVDDIVVVDDLTNSEKFKNIADCSIRDYRDYRSFLADLEDGRFSNVDLIFHLGACSDTMESDGRYMMEINYEYSRKLLEFCASSGVRLIYASSASVYGGGSSFAEVPRNETALNIYAYSKLLFDRYVRNARQNARLQSQVVGLRYFNVYGPREQHKARMASVAYHFYDQIREQKQVRLFEGSGGYGDGEQRRDFIWIDDAVDVNLFFMDHSDVSGIFNVGTGNARSFNDMACSVISSVRGSEVTVSELVESGAIAYVPFPQALEGKYQSYTQADVDTLRRAGYTREFTALEAGVRQYIDWRNGGQ